MLRPLTLAVSLIAGLAAQDTPTTTAEPAPPTELLLVANKADHSLSVFAPAERRQLATIPTGKGPHEVVVAPDGALAVVSDYGAQQDGSSLTVVDVDRRSVLRTITLTADEVDADGGRRTKTFLRPHGVQFVAARKVVVTSERARRLLLVDVDSGKVERTWSTPQLTMHMVAVSADLKRAAATSIKEGNVVFFDLQADGVASTPPIACGEGSEGLAVHPRTGHAWVGNRAANTVSIVDPVAGKVVHTLPTGDFPFRLAFTADGARAVVTCAEGGEVLVVDGEKHTVVHTVVIHATTSEQSAMPMGIALDSAGTRAFVTCGRGEFVATIDLAKGEVVDRLAARAGCDGIAWVRRPAADAGLRR